MSHRKKTKARILLVEDHPMTRMGLRMMINGEKDMEVCMEAANVGEGLDAALQTKPDIVITDVTLPGRSGLELTQDLHASCPDLPVLILSMHPETTYARRALEIGARGYIMKSESGDKVLQAIRCVLDGRIYVSEAISGHLLEFLSHRSKKKQTGIDSLAPREFEVFKLIGEGVSTVMIAKALNMSPKTVESHRARIKEKLQTKTISELIAHAAGWAAMQSMPPVPKVDLPLSSLTKV